VPAAGAGRKWAFNSANVIGDAHRRYCQQCLLTLLMMLMMLMTSLTLYLWLLHPSFLTVSSPSSFLSCPCPCPSHYNLRYRSRVRIVIQATFIQW
jgi:hypothetical protein